MGRSAVSRIEAQARVREVEALKLRIKGKSYRGIADALGISRSGAQAACIRAMARSEKEIIAEGMHLRHLESLRLLFAMEAIADLVQAGMPDAVREWRLLCESMRKLLGVDAPAKIAPTTPDGESEYTGLSDAEIERELAAFAAASAGPAE